MYNASLRIVNNQFDAEDILQESFLTGFDKLDSFKGEVAFGAWLKRIVINNSLTQLKKNNRFEEVKLESVKNETIDSEDLEIFEDITAGEIVEKMNQLKDNYRIILNLYLIEGFDYEEISQVLEISYQNTKTMVFRAKNKLKIILER